MKFLALIVAGFFLSISLSLAQEKPTGKKKQTIKNAEIAYVESGNLNGQPVLFLHGIPTSSYLWRNIMPGLESDNYRLIAMDFVGFGDSSGQGYGVLNQAIHLENFVKALELNNIILVTHDWGAGIGLMFAERNPQRVSAFATMEGALPPVYPRPNMESFGKAAKFFETMRNPETRERVVLHENAWLTFMLPRSVITPLSETDLAAYHAPFPTPESRRPILDMTLSLPVGGEPADVTKAYEAAALWWQETDIPKLVLYATPGRLQPQAKAQWAAENLKNVTTKEIGPGIHYIQEDSPQGITMALQNWLQSL